MAGCEIVELKKNTPASNRAERGIQELKMETKRDMKLSGSPMVFWCYCIEQRSEIIACSARNNPNLNGMVRRSMMTGEVTDISHLCNFQWYTNGLNFDEWDQRLLTFTQVSIWVDV